MLQPSSEKSRTCGNTGQSSHLSRWEDYGASPCGSCSQAQGGQGTAVVDLPRANCAFLNRQLFCHETASSGNKERAEGGVSEFSNLLEYSHSQF